MKQIITINKSLLIVMDYRSIAILSSVYYNFQRAVELFKMISGFIMDKCMNFPLPITYFYCINKDRFQYTPLRINFYIIIINLSI